MLSPISTKITASIQNHLTHILPSKQIVTVSNITFALLKGEIVLEKKFMFNVAWEL